MQDDKFLYICKMSTYRLIAIIFLLMTTSNTFSQVRPAANAGSFYNASPTRLKAEIEGFYSHCGDIKSRANLAAIIVPHAGYVFSGQVAAKAFAAIDTRKTYDRIFLLGPSHYVWLGGASVNYHNDAYATPLGQVAVDTVTGKRLSQSESLFTYNAKAHDREHCLEVELPLLQVRLGSNMPPIVPVIISTNDVKELKRIANALKPYFNEHNLFVVSSDFSHYPSYDDACRIDSLTCRSILTGKPEEFIKCIESNERLGIRNLQTSACGEFPITTLLYMLNDNYKLSCLDYANSGYVKEAGKSRVVGYNAIIVERKSNIVTVERQDNTTDNDSQFTLTEADKIRLLALARSSISAALGGKEQVEVGKSAVEQTKCGAFVTLTIGGRLRGCIGHIGDDMELGTVVSHMARAAALEDPRFPRLTRDELSQVKIEISVLTPLLRIKSIDEFQLHRDGLLIRKGYSSGTFLPQVANEVNWTKEEFFGHCSRDKAGLGWDGWRTAELYTYRAIVFSEK